MMIEWVPYSDHKIKVCSKALRMPAGCLWPSYGNQLETKNCSTHCGVNQLKSARIVKRPIALPSERQSDGLTRIVDSNRPSIKTLFGATYDKIKDQVVAKQK